MNRPSDPPAAPHRGATLPGRRERQSRLLDDALLETFPASDPVSVILID